MATYFDDKDLAKFGKISDWQKDLGDKFFGYYGAAMEAGALSKKTKALIALAVSHSEKCPYCIDAYTKECVKLGVEEVEMMEAVHVAASMKAGITLVHGVQMMNKAEKLLM